MYIQSCMFGAKGRPVGDVSGDRCFKQHGFHPSSCTAIHPATSRIHPAPEISDENRVTGS